MVPAARVVELEPLPVPLEDTSWGALPALPPRSIEHLPFLGESMDVLSSRSMVPSWEELVLLQSSHPSLPAWQAAHKVGAGLGDATGAPAASAVAALFDSDSEEEEDLFAAGASDAEDAYEFAFDDQGSEILDAEIEVDAEAETESSLLFSHMDSMPHQLSNLLHAPLPPPIPRIRPGRKRFRPPLPSSVSVLPQRVGAIVEALEGACLTHAGALQEDLEACLRRADTSSPRLPVLWPERALDIARRIEPDRAARVAAALMDRLAIPAASCLAVLRRAPWALGLDPEGELEPLVEAFALADLSPGRLGAVVASDPAVLSARAEEDVLPVAERLAGAGMRDEDVGAVLAARPQILHGRRARSKALEAADFWAARGLQREALANLVARGSHEVEFLPPLLRFLESRVGLGDAEVAQMPSVTKKSLLWTVGPVAEVFRQQGYRVRYMGPCEQPGVVHALNYVDNATREASAAYVFCHATIADIVRRLGAPVALYHRTRARFATRDLPQYLAETYAGDERRRAFDLYARELSARRGSFRWKREVDDLLLQEGLAPLSDDELEKLSG